MSVRNLSKLSAIHDCVLTEQSSKTKRNEDLFYMLPLPILPCLPVRDTVPEGQIRH